MAVTIRPLAAGETASLLPLNRQVQALHVAAHPGIFRADAGDAEVEAYFRTWLARDEVVALVAVGPAGQMLGYAVYEIEQRAATALQAATRRGVLHHIVVDERWRRRGVAALLLADVRSRLRAAGITRIRAVFYVFNAASAGLLRKAGIMPLTVTAEGPA